MMPTAPFPVFVLTGYLGSGKTTLLRSLLAHPGMADTAVIINEFGEIGLDHFLVREVTEEVVLLGSGCVCCTVRDDLASTLNELATMRSTAAIPAFARVVVETTGLADPAPIIQTLMGNSLLSEHYRLAGLVATVDAVFGGRQLDAGMETVKQTALADQLVLTKTDLAEAAARDALRRRIGRLNPQAPLIESAEGRFPAPGELFGLRHDEQTENGVSDWLRKQTYRAHAGSPAADSRMGRHEQRIATFVVRIADPVDRGSFLEWLELLLASRGENILRMKGLVHFKGDPSPWVVQGVQHMLHPLTPLREWPDADHGTRIVFITRDFTRTAVETSMKQILGAVPMSG
jgi:G3E family GTPase